MYKIILSIIFLVVLNKGYAENLSTAGARALGMAKSVTAVADDNDGIIFNPSLIAGVKKNNIQFSGMSILHGLDDVSYFEGSVSSIIPLSSFSLDSAGTVGVSVDYNTINIEGVKNIFSQLYVNLAYAYSLLDFIKIGILGKYYRWNVSYTADFSGGTFDVGVGAAFFYSLKKRYLRIALFADNLLELKENYLKRSINFGIAYPISFILIDIDVKYIAGSINLSAGMEFKIEGIKGLFLRCGSEFLAVSNGINLASGIGYGTGRFIIDYGFGYSLNINTGQHQLSVTYNF